VPTALLTGASTGIGRATALRLTASGWDVFAGVRDPAVGEALAGEAQEGKAVNASAGEAGNAPAGKAPGLPGSLTPLQLDVTDQGQIEQAAAAVREKAPGGALHALVNNAGVAIGGPLETLPLDELRQQLDVNFFGQVAVTQALLPALRIARGRIVFLSSVGGLITTPYMAPYHASKYAIEAVANSLRIELAASHIQVALIEPGSVKTPIWDKGRELVDGVSLPDELQHLYGHVPAAMRKTLEDTARRGLPPERVAQTIEQALTARRMRARYIVGTDARAMVLISRVLPARTFDRVLRRAVGV
jgi:NAD(P)-dependent dehydrogenase (short-subunit alcohol dehydrogenase family)